MKLTAIALCVGGLLAGAAQAQSSVTPYGILDAGYLYTDTSGQPSKSELADGIQSQSRFGLRGREDLGGGIATSFTLEGGIGIDTGTSQQSGRLFGRQAWVAIGHRTGELRLGRQYGIGYEYFLSNTSPFGTSFRDAGSGNVFSSAAGRMILDNVVMLRTGNFNGFSGALGYSFQGNGSEVAGSGNNAKVLTAGARYQSGRVYAALSYERVNCPDTTTGTTFNTCNAVTRDDQSNLQIGGSVEFSPVRVYAMWAQEKNQFSYVAVTPAKKAQVYELGAKVKLLGGDLLASFQKRDDRDYDADLDVWALGYTYPLSRRTNLYTFVSDTKADETPTAQITSGGAIVQAGYTASQIAAYRERDRLQFAFGLRHTF